MMNLIKPISPQYKGTSSQPKNGGGLLSQIFCYLFGGATPAYKGQGQPAPKGCSVPLFPSTPVYTVPVDPKQEAEELPPDDGGGDAVAVPMTSGKITIVVG
jgi:hypothetical protein